MPSAMVGANAYAATKAASSPTSLSLTPADGQALELLREHAAQEQAA
jgi:hypothetical protein